MRPRTWVRFPPSPSGSRKAARLSGFSRSPRSARARMRGLAPTARNGENHRVSTVMPETHYAKAADGVHIAYQVVGSGPVDLIFANSWCSHIEFSGHGPR